jgi:hypothetical protein
VTTVQVSDDSSGTISFAATIANRPVLTDVDAVQAFFDTDKNAGTGGNGGYDFEVAWITGHQEIDKWDRSQFATMSPAPTSFSASLQERPGRVQRRHGRPRGLGRVQPPRHDDRRHRRLDERPCAGRRQLGYPTSGTVAPPTAPHRRRLARRRLRPGAPS